MSVLKLDAVQLGDNADATKNFTFRTNNNGTLTLARGNVGATTQDLLTLDAAGRVAMPQTVVAFSAYLNTGQVVGTIAKIQLGAEEFDTANAFDSAANFRFQPAVAGYYQLFGSVQGGSANVAMQPFIYKNGVNRKSGSFINASGAYQTVQIVDMVYLNGTTDYVELWGTQSVSQAMTSGAGNGTYFQGSLIAKA